MIKTTLDVLKAARKLLANKKRWCKGEFALAKGGRVVEAYLLPSRAACRFCAIGAIWQQGVGNSDTWSAVEELEKSIRVADAFSWNDAPRRTHAQILKAFDKTIARLEKTK